MTNTVLEAVSLRSAFYLKSGRAGPVVLRVPQWKLALGDSVVNATHNEVLYIIPLENVSAVTVLDNGVPLVQYVEAPSRAPQAPAPSPDGDSVQIAAEAIRPARIIRSAMTTVAPAPAKKRGRPRKNP